jgi:hypothetical protein
MIRTRAKTAFFLLALVVFLTDAVAQTSGATGFGGSYSSLRPEQKRLIDDWFKRFSSVVTRTVDAGQGYDNLPLSTKTTFNAVTHALLTTNSRIMPAKVWQNQQWIWSIKSTVPPAQF